ncbi:MULTISPECIES: RHS repeat domain-containing protein [unclassified Pseudomonas]|uniref:RHS repeat-associated core domain-containing protein n=1 Tax=Pseudomonas sp. MYb327 TaxID=2745230 RepID=A0AAU8E5E4_9PSED
MADPRWIDARTPTLTVVDSRGLAVRNVAYYRHPLNAASQTRITRNHFDTAGRHIASWDPRLWGTAPKPNIATTYDLQAQLLLVDSADAGWQLSLLDQSDLACSFWDGRGSQRHTEFDELQRPTTVTEQMKDASPRVAERFAYGWGTDEFAIHNQCGQLIRHDHPAGSRRFCEYGVSGLLLSEQTRFLRDLEPADWSSEFADAWLEDEVFQTTQQCGPLGEMRGQTDAMDNVRSFAHDRAGQLCESRLKLADSSGEPRLLVSEIVYDAFGRIVSERSGNGVTTTVLYAPEDGRLMQLLSCNGSPLQNLRYSYDPVGNICSIEDKAEGTRYFNSQRIDPINHYFYDSLYQLVRATGREVSQPSYGPALPPWQTIPLDPNRLRNYTQTFNYDAAGNLLTRFHSGAANFEMFTSPYCNRSVVDRESLADGFDANGNQQELQRGQRMSWDSRNQLSRVTLVRREDGPDDTECYFYDSPGHRLRKVRLTETARRTLHTDVRYLPGLEVHRNDAIGEERHVITVEAGHSHVRGLHWVTKMPAGVHNDQLRYCLTDHLNSCTLELDELGALLNREVYYPFGGTALWAGSSETEVKYKTIRYSGKERDATGLYYYGYRYYAPWLQRWVSPDPAGDIDGVNLFIFVGNEPCGHIDLEGLVRGGINEFLTRDGDWNSMKLDAGRQAMLRQESVYKGFDVKPSRMRRNYLMAFTNDSNVLVNDYLRHGRKHGVLSGRFYSVVFVASEDSDRVSALTKVVSELPHTGNIPLYRGGSGERGTSGEFFRDGRLGPGSILVNSDFTSFTENPYVAAEFAALNQRTLAFDNSSVIFEVVDHFSPKPIAPDSLRFENRVDEVESLVMPAAAFEVLSVDLVDIVLKGVDQNYVHVSIKELEPPKVTSDSSSVSTLPGNVHDLRTGELLNFDQLKKRLGNSANQLLKGYYS